MPSLPRNTPAPGCVWVGWCLLLAVFAGASCAARAGAALFTHPAADTSFVLDAEGQLWAWGDNTDGALGDGTRESRAQPRAVTAPGVTRWRTAAPGRRVLAFDQDSRLWAWGFGRQGGPERPAIVSPPNVRWATAAGLPGLDVNLLITEAGEVWRWEFVGKSWTSPGGFPGYFLGSVDVPGAVGAARRVVSGESHALLLTGSGQLFAYGSNHLAQCGPAVASGFAAAWTPVPAPEPARRWVDVAGGADTSFGRLSNGEWYFWGAAFVHGSNGVATVATREPTRIRRPRDVATWEQVVAGRSFLLLRAEGGRAYGLGDNVFGALAYPWQRQWSLSYTNEPRRVFAVGPQTNRVAELAAGLNHALALDERGELYTWGNNAAGQLGRAALGDAWQPARVRGAHPPFSPAADPLPELEWVPLQPTLVSPLLAGQPGQAAQFQIRRRRDLEFPLPIRLEPTSEHSLPGLPWDQVLGLGSLNLAPLESLLPITLTAGPYGGTTVSASLRLRAVAPPWVVWPGGNTTPLNVNFPRQWSRPPTARLMFPAGPVLRAGQTNLLSLGCYDPDGWVSSVQLMANCRGCAPREAIFDLKFRRGIAGLTNWMTLPWVPRAGEFPAGSNMVQFSALLQDNAGAVVTQFLGQASFRGDPGFRASWNVAGPIVEPAAPVGVRIEQLIPDVVVVDARLALFDANGGAHGTYPLTQVPGETPIPFPATGSYSGRVRIETATGREEFALPLLSRRPADGLPYVSLEAITPSAFEGGAVGAIRVARFGGDLSRPLTVRLRVGTVSPATLPTPRRDDAPAASAELDYERLPATVTLPVGVPDLSLPVRPVDDSLAEGNEGVRLVLVPDFTAYHPFPERSEALVVIHDDERLPRPKVEISRPEAATVHPAGQPLEVVIRPVTEPGTRVVERELFADGLSVGDRSTLPAPLPVGPMVLQGRVTDSFGQVAWSEPLTVEVVPELRLRGREARADGTEMWRVEAAPDFQELRLEAGPNLGDWQPGLAWRPSPTNRIRDILVPAGADAHFLRLVPAGP